MFHVYKNCSNFMRGKLINFFSLESFIFIEDIEMFKKKTAGLMFFDQFLKQISLTMK